MSPLTILLIGFLHDQKLAVMCKQLRDKVGSEPGKPVRNHVHFIEEPGWALMLKDTDDRKTNEEKIHAALMDDEDLGSQCSCIIFASGLADHQGTKIKAQVKEIIEEGIKNACLGPISLVCNIFESHS